LSLLHLCLNPCGPRHPDLSGIFPVISCARGVFWGFSPPPLLSLSDSLSNPLLPLSLSTSFSVCFAFHLSSSFHLSLWLAPAPELSCSLSHIPPSLSWCPFLPLSLTRTPPVSFSIHLHPLNTRHTYPRTHARKRGKRRRRLERTCFFAHQCQKIPAFSSLGDVGSEISQMSLT